MTNTSSKTPTAQAPAKVSANKGQARTAAKGQAQVDGQDSDELPLPEEGDRLFERGKFSIDQAEVEHHELYRFQAMKDGYKLSGDVLVQYWLTQRRNRFNNSLIFPILFCYRHFLELSMKWLLWHVEEYRSKSIFNDHSLEKLWNRCRLVFKDFRIDVDAHVDASQSLILELHEKDMGSFNFRYTFHKSGEVIDLEIQAVDLIRLREGVEKLDNFFDIAETIIRVELDARSAAI